MALSQNDFPAPVPVSAGNPRKLAAELAVELYRISRRIRSTKSTGQLSMPELSALLSLGDREMTVSELAAAEGVRVPSITRMAETLVAAGLITKKTDPDDQRRSVVAATPLARRLVDHGLSHRSVDDLVDLVADLTPAEIAQLEGAADTLRRMSGRESREPMT